MKKLRFGIVGGAEGSFIGTPHVNGAQMDHLAVITAACFSRDLEKNKRTAAKWGIAPDRVYATYQEMAEKEAAREDGIDFIIIATPNNTHYEIAHSFLSRGFHVSCDKPVSITLEESLDLKKLAREKNLHFGVSYSYVQYAMVHQMRKMIADGKIGKILNVISEYPQDWALVMQDNNPDGFKNSWRFNPEISGPSSCTADIGTHAEELIHFTTGLEITSVLARMSNLPPSAPMETDVQMLLKLEGNVPGMLWASQVAAGHECGVCVRVYGDKGSLIWNHDNPTELLYTPLHQPEQRLTCAHKYLDPDVRRMSRLAYGHPEGYFEAFDNYYRSFCTHLLHLRGEAEPAFYPHPTIEDGIRGMRFVEASLKSDAAGNVWVDV